MDITHDDENAAFDKLRSKFERLAPWAKADDTQVLMPKLTVRDVRAMLQMYRRHCA